MYRRRFFQQSSASLSWAALAALLSTDQRALGVDKTATPPLPHFAPKAKRIIYLFQSGGPSQIDLFDYKPRMAKIFDQDLPDSVRGGQRFTTMTSGQSRFPIAPSIFKFAQRGQAGMWLSELLPYTSKMVDDICLIRSMHTEAINHDPAVISTGNPPGCNPSTRCFRWYRFAQPPANRLDAFGIVPHSGVPFSRITPPFRQPPRSRFNAVETGCVFVSLLCSLPWHQRTKGGSWVR